MTTCQRCGACCRHLLIVASAADAKREPRIAEERKHQTRSDTYSLGGPCPFLHQGWSINQCTIYATRPDDCRGFEPGGEQCREARGVAERKEKTVRI